VLLVLQALLSFASCFGRGLARLRSLQLLTCVSRRACQLLATLLYRMSHIPGKHEPDRHPKQATRDAQQGQAYRQKDDGNAQHDCNEPENGRDDPQDSTCESAENPHGSAGSGMRRKGAIRSERSLRMASCAIRSRTFTSDGVLGCHQVMPAGYAILKPA
jgi:hypothetical protein